MTNVLEGNIKRHIFILAIPTIIGHFSFVIFNFTDTFFVSKLGTDALAAMGYTLPIMLVVSAMSTGVAIGASSLVSRAKGSNNIEDMKRISSDGIILSLIIAFIFSVVGILTARPLFSALGAEGNVLELVIDYMTIWYVMLFAIVMPPVVDSCMRANADMIRPLIVMLICALVNTALDPLLIHGYWIFPEMGIKGAALATVIARSLGMIATLLFAHKIHGLISLKIKSIKEYFISWKEIMVLGIPSVGTKIMPQLLRALMTSLAAATTGSVGVAALAIGSRIESIALMAIYGMGSAFIPIIGQNFGAGKYDRVEETRKIMLRVAFYYSVIIIVLVIFLARPLSSIFTSDADVLNYSTYYLIIMLSSLAGLALRTWISQAFTTIGKPMFTLYINIIGVAVLMMPFALLGSYLFGFVGMLVGVAVSQLILGLISSLIGYKYLKA